MEFWSIVKARKWWLAGAGLVLAGGGGFGVLMSLESYPPETQYTVATHYFAREVLDLGRPGTANTIVELDALELVRVEDNQDGFSAIEVVDGRHKGEHGWVVTSWLRPASSALEPLVPEARRSQ